MLDPKLKRKIQKLVDNKESIELATLDATLELGDKLDDLKTAIESIPETVIPDFPEIEQSEVIFPEVQKVEVTNFPEQKTDTDVQNLLKELVAEVKKKEQYTYDIEIDSTLKEQLKGETGLNGKDGVDGKDGTEIEAETIKEKLESLKGGDKLKMSAIRDLNETIATLQNRTQLLNQIATTRSSTSQATGIILISPNGTRWELGITNAGEITATSL